MSPLDRLPDRADRAPASHYPEAQGCISGGSRLCFYALPRWGGRAARREIPGFRFSLKCRFIWEEMRAVALQASELRFLECLLRQNERRARHVPQHYFHYKNTLFDKRLGPHDGYEAVPPALSASPEALTGHAVGTQALKSRAVLISIPEFREATGTWRLF